ncbi:hypothetical protein K502DRAFT_343754 [Neoconidiobolus thromboides FSU 785]|nr:hypothetical protein K502DRAFT_343754 [Neoconidiobolus thromboides FSU 785]
MFLLIFHFLLYVINCQLPRMTSGGCTIADDEIYCLGGQVQLPQLEEMTKYNNKIFRLSLREDVKLEGGIAPWKVYSSMNDILEMHSQYCFYVKKRKSIINFYVNYEKQFLISCYDIEKNKWYTQDRTDEILRISKIHQLFKGNEFYLNVIQSVSDPNQFYVTLCIYDSSTLAMTPLPLFLFDNELDSFRTLTTKLPAIVKDMMFLLNEKLYYFSSKAIDNTYIEVNYSVLYEMDLMNYDIKSHNLENSKISGEEYARIIIGDQVVYFITTPSNKISHIYELDLNKNKFIEKKINYKIAEGGNILYYNHFIINSFGYESNQLDSSDKTQLINTNTWELDGILPALVKNRKEEPVDDNNDNNYNMNVLIGGIVGGSIGIIIILLIPFIIFYRRRLKKKQLPKPLTDPIFINTTSPLPNNELVFHHSSISTDSIELKSINKGSKNVMLLEGYEYINQAIEINRNNNNPADSCRNKTKINNGEKSQDDENTLRF